MDLSFLERVPAYLRKGPWATEAWVTVFTFGAYLLYTHFDVEVCAVARARMLVGCDAYASLH